MAGPLDPLAMAQQFLANPDVLGKVGGGPQIGERRTVGNETRAWNGERWMPIPTDEPSDYVGGFLKSGFDTLRKAGKGVLEGLNPITAVSDLAHAVAHPIDTVGGIASAVMHPVQTAQALSDPETGGKVIGNLLLGKVAGKVLPKVPEVAADVADRVPGALNSAGRGLEAVGQASKKPLSTASIVELAGNHPVAAAATYGAPYAAEYGGRGLQRLGRALEGLRRGDAPVVEQYSPNVSGYQPFTKSAVEDAIAGNRPVPSHLDLSQPVPAGDLTQAQIAERIGAVQENGGLNFDTPRRGPGGRPVKPVSEPPSLAALAGEGPESVGEAASPNPATSGPFVSRNLPVDNPMVDTPPEFLRFRGPRISQAELDNLRANTHYGNGAVLPNHIEAPGAGPSEVAWNGEGVEAPDTGLTSASQIYPHVNVPEFSFEGSAAARPGELPPPGLTVGEAGSNPLSRLETALKGLDSDATVATNPAEELAQRLGTPSDDTVRATVAQRNAAGRWNGEMQPFSEFSDALDEIINQATPEDMPPQRPTGLAASRPTNATKDWIRRRAAADPNWPYLPAQ